MNNDTKNSNKAAIIVSCNLVFCAFILLAAGLTEDHHNIEKVPLDKVDSNLVDKSKNQDSLQQVLTDNNLTETKIVASMRNGSDVVQTTNITVTAEDLNDSAIQMLTSALNKRLIAMRNEDKKTKPVTLKIKE